MSFSGLTSGYIRLDKTLSNGKLLGLLKQTFQAVCPPFISPSQQCRSTKWGLGLPRTYGVVYTPCTKMLKQKWQWHTALTQFRHQAPGRPSQSYPEPLTKSPESLPCRVPLRWSPASSPWRSPPWNAGASTRACPDELLRARRLYRKRQKFQTEVQSPMSRANFPKQGRLSSLRWCIQSKTFHQFLFPPFHTTLFLTVLILPQFFLY